MRDRTTSMLRSLKAVTGPNRLWTPETEATRSCRGRGGGGSVAPAASVAPVGSLPGRGAVAATPVVPVPRFPAVVVRLTTAVSAREGSSSSGSTPAIFVRVFVLGIDPGLSRCGYAVVEPAPRGRGRAVAMGVLRTSVDEEVPMRLARLLDDFEELLDEFTPAVVSVERIFFQNNTRTAVGVAQASGLALALAARRGLTVAQYSPSEVKAVVAGDGAAVKAQVQEMVQMLLGLEKPPRPADAADAAALALCHLAHDPHLRLAGAR